MIIFHLFAIHIVSDLDSTIINTDEILIQKVIPKVIEKFNIDFSPFIITIKKNNSLPSAYALHDWEQWNFPVKKLGQALNKSDQEALIEFWQEMSIVFKTVTSEAPIFPEFLRIVKKLESHFGELQWTILTARTQVPLHLTIEHLLHPNWITRTKRGTSSEDNSTYKLQALQNIKFDFYIENDRVILEKLSKYFPDKLILAERLGPKVVYKPYGICTHTLTKTAIANLLSQ